MQINQLICKLINHPGGPIPSPSTFSSPAQPFGKEAVIFKCYHCPENFNDMNLRRAHWIARHSNVFRRIEGKYYHTCSFPGCNRDNMLTSRFMAHFRRSHLKKKRKILTPRYVDKITVWSFLNDGLETCIIFKIAINRDFTNPVNMCHTTG